ncbi:ralBP1-associated Eps domain-containing protein 1 isoform X11 [Octopus bimaculoides]|uniref:ralBP1-associated Eps domain-containing protein 1 isoform X11 n=1 Tax=Octopus bimaculoides TaxID=37653 RepID=UPI00071CF010|nr:ralBP1-associated Eps domain-containing protein 1 isoform X11 [Octopus bimaculoides]|eukprot:XP_014784623.1 PREDICTED: ralBP1-associated Eps domain-containing protein 1-like isoform X12 [Octopus bimaculoides]
MEGLKLCEQEQRYYGELFQNCDVEGSGRVTGSKALDLFRLSGLNQEVLQQISELCGAKRLGHFGRSQFYIALKLIAAVQCGLPAKLDSLNLAMEVSLPKFHRANGHEKWKNQASPTISSNVISGESDATPIQDGVCPVNTSSGNQVTSSRTTSQPALSQPTGQLPPPPATKKSHIRNLSGQYRSLTDNPSQYSQLDQKNFFLKNRKNAPRRPTSLGYPLKSRDESPLDSKSPPFSPKQSPPTSPTNRVKLGNIGKQQTAPASVNTSMTTSGTNVAANAGCVGQVTPVATVYPAMPSQFVSPATTTPVTNTTGNVVPGTVGSGSGLPGLVTAAVAPSPSAYTNSVHDVSGWASFEDEESKGLLDTGANKMSWENIESQGVDSSSISSENESIDDVWTISKEQREYYLKQFKTMQPEENGVIIGSIAKEFFEKSKLPVHELSKIWQLSDLNRDGALSLDEFCIAMHLVVLRRNEIELPDHLPVSLMPYSTLTNGKNEPFAADLPPGSTLKRLTPTTPPSNQWTRTTFPVESPTSSGLSSPAPKPVNFEFSKPVATDPDSKIIHPVALRMSPDGHPIPPEITDRNNWTAAGTATGVYHLNPYLKRYWATFGMYRASKSFQGIQQLTGTSVLLPPPAVPPRTSPKDGLPPITTQTDTDNVDSSIVNNTSVSKVLPEPEEEVMSSDRQKSSYYGRQPSRDKRELQMAISTHKERNAMLERVNSELNQELQEVMEQRIALEIQLEHLRPYHS